MTKTSDDKSQGMPEGLYCNAAICNGCGHVYMERPSSCDCGNDERINGFEPAAVFTTADLSTPAAPQADEWVKCADRLPTEADDDYQGCVWVHFEDGEVELMEAEEVEQTWDDDISITHWVPAGLTRPQPPEQGDGV